MEKVSMASGAIAFIDPEDALLVLTGNVQRSTYSKVMRGIQVAGGALAIGLSVASRANTSWATGISVGSAFFPSIAQLISGSIQVPSIIPLTSTVKWPVTLAPGACLTDHWFAAKMKNPHPESGLVP